MRSSSRIRRVWSLSAAVALVAGASIGFAGPVAAGGAPPNDDFASATVVGSLPFTQINGNAGASIETGEPVNDQCKTPANNTMWFRYTPTTTQIVRADTTGSDFDTAIAVWKGTSLAALTPVVCNNDVDSGSGGSGPDALSSIAFRAVAGKRYSFQVGTFSASTHGSLTFRLKPVTPPALDAFANAATVAALPFSAAVHTRNTTIQAGEPSGGCAPLEGTVWYRYHPTTTRTVRVDSLASDFDTGIDVFRAPGTASLATLVSVGCDDDAPGGTTTFQSSVTFRAVGGVTYYFRAGGYLGAHGLLKINARSVTPPANDRIDGATDFSSLPFGITESTRNATYVHEPAPDSECTSFPAQTVWFKYSPSASGSVQATVVGSDFNAFVQVWDLPSGSEPSRLTCGTSAAGFSAVAGRQYLLQIGGSSGGSGSLVLNVHEGP